MTSSATKDVTRSALGALLGFALTLAHPLPAGAQGSEASQSRSGAAVMVLDSINGSVTGPVEIPSGGEAQILGLVVRVQDCRSPVDNPASDAFAHLVIEEAITSAQGTPKAPPLFEGWMIASSPALSALEHPRYDLWVDHCF